jgi:uncharacterized membrane protein YhaH (DUF805 family)
MILVQSLIAALQNYGNFSGRASRGNYWWYILGYVIVVVILAFVDGAVFGGGQTMMDTSDGMNVSYNAGPLAAIWIIGNIIPLIAAAVRRLHDTDRSGWFYLLMMIPLVNFYVIYVLASKGTAGENRFGAARVA